MREDGNKYDSADFLDIREELENLLPHFQWYVLRHLDYSKPCSCTQVPADKINLSQPCTRCLRFGYIFTDYLVKGYMWKGTLGFEFKTDLGVISTQSNNFIVRHNRTINKFDQVILVDMNPDTGVIRQPVKMRRMFLVQDSLPIYGKDGRIEFFRTTIEERSIDDYRSGQIGNSFIYRGNRSNP